MQTEYAEELIDELCRKGQYPQYEVDDRRQDGNENSHDVYYYSTNAGV